MVKELERLALRSKTVVVGFNIYNNWRFSRRFRVGNAASDHGVVHVGLDLPASLRYIDMSYDVFVKCPGFSADVFRDRSILEAGTGDNFGLALTFLAAGARRVVTIDKFYSKRDPEQQRRIYLAMRERLDSEGRARFDRAVDLSAGIKTNDDVLRYVYGIGIEEADRILPGDRFDFVISKGALQDVPTIDRAFAVMDDLLAPGGWMIHKIDLSDQGMFSRNGQHPLTYLTIPDSVYGWMSTHSGKANRRLRGYYEGTLRGKGYDVRVLATRVLGRDRELKPHKERLEAGVDYTPGERALVAAIRPKLLPRYRDLPQEELLTSGIMLLGRKPGRP
jgi:SAM-dependent methyltransferase